MSFRINLAVVFYFKYIPLYFYLMKLKEKKGNIFRIILKFYIIYVVLLIVTLKRRISKYSTLLEFNKVQQNLISIECDKLCS